MATVGVENENPAGKLVETTTSTRNEGSDVVLVDFEEKDPTNPFELVFKPEMADCVRYLVDGIRQVLQEFNSRNKLQQVLIVTIWELGEGVGPFFIAPLSERFGRLPVFHVGNFLALCCLIASALSVKISMLIAFWFLTGCFLSILILGPAIVRDLFEIEHSCRSMTLVVGTQMIADFISPVAGSYIAQRLGWRWAIWLADIVLGFFSLCLLFDLRETYAVVILRQKTERLQKESTDDKKYRSKHQARVDASTVLASAMKPLHILAQSPVLVLTTIYMATKYGLLSLIIATLTEAMQSIYPTIFIGGSVGVTFLSLAIGNTMALIIYSLTSDRYLKYQQKTKGDAFKPGCRLIHLMIGAVILPVGFLIYGWTLAFHVQYIAPLIGAGVAGFSLTLATISIETYVVDV